MSDQQTSNVIVEVVVARKEDTVKVMDFLKSSKFIYPLFSNK